MDKNKRKKIILISVAAAIALVAAIIIWNTKFSATRIAFVNYQVTTLGQIAKSNHNSFVKISEVSLDDLDELDRYDMVFVNGMGLRVTAEQRQQIEDAAITVPVLTTAATSPENMIISVDSLTEDTLSQYLSAGGRCNYASLLNYVRTNIDCKVISDNKGFPFERVEENQKFAMRMFQRRTGELCWFALRLPDGSMWMVPLEKIETLKGRGKRRLTDHDIRTETWPMERWLHWKETQPEDEE